MKKLQIALTALLLFNCTTSPGPQTPQSSSSPLAYRVTLPGSPGEITILGSLHFGTEEMYPLPHSVTQAYDRSGILILETDLAQKADPAVLMARIQLPPGKTLSSFLDQETLDILNPLLPQLGLRLQDLEPFQPWYVDLSISLKLIQQTGLKPDLGVDQWFFTRYAAAKKDLRPLETMEYQLSILAPEKIGEQIVSLKETIKQTQDFKGYLDKLVKAWIRGDDKLLQEEYLNSLEALPELYDRFIIQRNKKWADKLNLWVGEDQKFFMVVGVAHLVGKDSVLNLLEARGFKLTRL
ncbi:MAG: hypothetical protein A2Z96_02520 [Spirochaetes bacterium GWB1_48_6]|nr:MAG: hypothetical protein A2Z96_02520 [Spirochaetes bacterium GWB1_48_6]